MIQSVTGTLIGKADDHIVVEMGGVGFKIHAPASVYGMLPEAGEIVQLFTHLHVREDLLELYGFTSERELELFEHLIGISGIGPKSALGILGVTTLDRLIAAIKEGKADLITKVSGVGKKTAGRVILELKDKLKDKKAPHLISLMESDVELEETLVGLGFTKTQAREAIEKIPLDVKGFKNRLREVLKNTKRNIV